MRDELYVLLHSARDLRAARLIEKGRAKCFVDALDAYLESASAKALAAKIGCSPQFVCDVRHGRRGISDPQLNRLIVAIKDEFDGAEIGDEVVLELCEMTREEIDTLPEFDGW